MKKILLFLTIFILICLVSCKKSEIKPIESTTTINKVDTVIIFAKYHPSNMDTVRYIVNIYKNSNIISIDTCHWYKNYSTPIPLPYISKIISGYKNDIISLKIIPLLNSPRVIGTIAFNNNYSITEEIGSGNWINPASEYVLTYTIQ